MSHSEVDISGQKVLLVGGGRGIGKGVALVLRVCGAAVADAGCVPLARVPEGSHHYIKRVLDAGAWGIVVPMVNTVEQARIAIAAAKYPPTGNRSLGRGMHAMHFDATGGEHTGPLPAGEVVLCPAGVAHGIRNVSEAPLCCLVFMAPHPKPPLSDA